MYKSDPSQCCYYISIVANIWYLIKLIHSIIIILRVYMFYKQRVLANFWGRKDSANCASRKRRGACYCAVHMKWAINSLFMPTTYTLNLFSVFHYLALMYKTDPPQCCYYISIFANIWYLIKLIHSIIIILREFMFYKQRVLANFWGRKDSANCASRKRRGALFTALCISYAQRSNTHLCACDWHNSRCLFDLKSLPRRAVYKTQIRARHVGNTSMLLLYQYFCQHLILD